MSTISYHTFIYCNNCWKGERERERASYMYFMLHACTFFLTYPKKITDKFLGSLIHKNKYKQVKLKINLIIPCSILHFHNLTRYSHPCMSMCTPLKKHIVHYWAINNADIAEGSFTNKCYKSTSISMNALNCNT